MITSTVVRKTAPLIAIPTIVTILLNIVGEDGVGPLGSGEAEIAVIVLAFLAVVTLQVRLSNDPRKAILKHAGIVAAYVTLCVLSDLMSEPRKAPSYFSFSVMEAIAVFMGAHCAISYVVVVTKTLAMLRMTPSAATGSQITSQLPRFKHVGIIVLAAIVEFFLIVCFAALSTSGTSEEMTELTFSIWFFLLSALNVFLMGRYSKNWKRTFRIHGIVVGSIAVIVGSVYGFFTVMQSSSTQPLLELMPGISMVYWLVSFILFGVALYVNAVKKEAGSAL